MNVKILVIALVALIATANGMLYSDGYREELGGEIYVGLEAIIYQGAVVGSIMDITSKNLDNAEVKAISGNDLSNIVYQMLNGTNTNRITMTFRDQDGVIYAQYVVNTQTKPTRNDVINARVI